MMRRVALILVLALCPLVLMASQGMLPVGISVVDSGGPVVPTEDSRWCFTASNGDDCTGVFDFDVEDGNPTYASASTPKGWMVELDGDDCLERSDANFIYDNGAQSAFTVTGWFYADSLQTAEIGAINYDWSSDYTLFLFEVQSDGDYKLRVKAGSATDTYESDNSNRYVASRWIFFAITYDDTDDGVDLWVDITADQSSLTNPINTTHSTGGTIPQEAPVGDPVDSLLGCRNGSSYGSLTSYFTGDISDVQLFASRLSQAEIEAVRDDR